MSEHVGCPVCRVFRPVNPKQTSSVGVDLCFSADEGVAAKRMFAESFFVAAAEFVPDFEGCFHYHANLGTARFTMHFPAESEQTVCDILTACGDVPIIGSSCCRVADILLGNISSVECTGEGC